ncbi:uncharacterized protein LOC133191618 [Saccostrea echinata]|uniref:uncharacterized protein LOC133191618 n=1 Tax=Saccostrea echinata TaxID=191078 RepID=UPI002A83C595|nr:uncharacterized protein LOC133191618 [Saccostrea echinata]
MLFFTCKWYRKRSLYRKTIRGARDEVPLSELSSGDDHRNDRSESENALRQSRLPRQYENVLYNRYSDNYNHICFRNRSSVPLRNVLDSNYGKIKFDVSHTYEKESHSGESSNGCIDVSEKFYSGELDITQRNKCTVDKKTHSSREHQRDTICTQKKPVSDLQLCSMNDFYFNTGNSQKGKSVSLNFEEVDEVYGFSRKDVQSLIGFTCEKSKLYRNNSVC